MASRRALSCLAAIAIGFACDELPPDSGQPEIVAKAAPPDPCARDAGPDWCHPEAADGGLPCRYGMADGICESSGVLEACECDDCVSVARCLGACSDDGFCSMADAGQGEDCSCSDCNNKVPECARPAVGCVVDGLCDPINDDCTCADCATDPACGSCVDNGVCLPFNEGCACADCEGTDRCQPAH